MNNIIKSENNKYFMVITGDRYPLGDAGAIRTQAFSKIFQQLGYRVFVVGMGRSTRFKKEAFEGTTYCSLRYPTNNIFFRILGRLKFANHAKKILKSMESSLLAGIIYVSGGMRILKYIKKYCQKNSIALYYDCVEWYSPCEFKRGDKSRIYKENDLLNSKYIDKYFKVFSISSYLEEYYKDKTIKTLRIPVIMNVNEIPLIKSKIDKKTTIIYAGSMGKKDRIDMFVNALQLISEVERSKIQMIIIGSTQNEYEKRFGKVSDEISNRQLFFKGKVGRSEVFRYLEQADFTMLIRPPEGRYARAGFPTKIVESLSAGIPVICNYTSDLSLYLQDDQNAVIVEEYSILACLKALKKVINLSTEKKAQMRMLARRTAERYFHYENYISSIKEFIADE